MAYLIGSDSTTRFSSTYGYNSGATFNRSMFNGNDIEGITPSSNGNADKLWLFINSWGTVANVKACLYDDNNLVETVVINNSVGTGRISVDLAGTTPLDTGSAYRLALYTDTDAILTLNTDTAGLAYRYSTASGNYTTPIDPLPAGGYDSANEFYWAIEEVSVSPVLTLPTATAISATALSGTVTTDGLASGTLYWYVDADATPPTVADIKAGTGSVIFGNQAVTATGLQSVASMSPLSPGTTYYVHYVHTDASGDSNIGTTTATATQSQFAIVTEITGGENLTGLDYIVFDGQDLETMTKLLAGNGETTDVNGDLVIDLNSVTVNGGDPLIIIIGDWTTIPTGTNKAAVCYTTVSLV